MTHQIVNDKANEIKVNCEEMLPPFQVPENSQEQIAIVGGGLASVHLALSLAQRGKTVRLFCKDNALAQGASGNKQGALYPLLTPENDLLSQFYQQAFLFSRNRIQQLHTEGFHVSHDFCGVLQTGYNQRSTDRLNKILHAQDWPQDIVQAISAQAANDLAGLDINKDGAFYPLGGWVCPAELTQAVFAKAQTLADVQIRFNSKITSFEQTEKGWLLHTNEQQFGPYKTVVNACGSGLINFEQTQYIPASNFRGQVSHIPSRNDLKKMKAVLCAHGYITPQHNQLHCMGASYVKDDLNRDFQPYEQLGNLEKMQQSFGESNWVSDIDITGNSARVGVRLVTRDHFPMLGLAPNYPEIVKQQKALDKNNKKLAEQYWKETRPAHFEGLYILGALGSRGLCSGALAAETLACILCNEKTPLSEEYLERMNPNRLWLRKLIKNRPIY
ncbi:FAD-dependent 5-carboxymethylaminomethyl-2-thiouridine(34) oxidoreductase MnmC [Parashewanella tropica]|uniref:FAD-dependent 5-carboxymethylaminomethyl-2-thiouridine(34) oxidoreductase MnmC n=1 Tax=Parashewanella tropica TaxID=2547970 RepID=UPI001059F5D7|nr:FAD-dependent 5-carboxymethylaminomethyl-2-thiouridine(34) oxidoreductase MnmC [Parashewanella tropica]